MNKNTSKPGELFNPFPGLRPFTVDESHLFFGREGQSKSVLKSLEENNFIAVIGASGSGKSSLIYCGVIPELKSHSDKQWIAVSTRPGTSPVKNLVASLSAEFEGKVKEDDEAKLLTGDYSIQDWVQGIVPKGQSLLLVIDQFEEIFRFKQSAASEQNISEVSTFVELLYAACTSSNSLVSVVLTMRSDFIGECSVFQNLTDLINRSNYLIPQMTRDDFRKAIEGPVKIGGAVIDEELVEQLLDEMGIDTDQLPVLQHALMRTWDYWMLQNDPSKSISIGDYEAIGRMEKALSDHANEAYDELNEGQRVVCENLFKTLTEKGGDNRGVRRPSTVVRVAEISRSTPAEIIEIAEIFRTKGRTFLTPYQPVEISENTVIDISHESLMRIWDRLRLWVDEEASSVQMYNRLSEASALYQEGTTGLWRPPDLQLALNWREKQQPTATWAVQYNPAFERAMVFMETSNKEFRKEEENKIRLQRRRLRITRMFSLVLGGIAIVAMGLFLWTRDLQSKAVAQSLLAEERKVQAEQSAFEADAERQRAELARDSADVERQKAIEASNLAEQQRIAADAARKLAIERKNDADASAAAATKAEEEAVEAAKIAEAERIKAENARNEAAKRRMLSIAQSMAVKSEQMRTDTLLKGLLAFQSYSFNTEFGGLDYDPDVFRAAYSGLKFFEGADYNVLKGHSSFIRTLAQAEGRVISGSSDGQVISWNMEDKTPTILLSGLPIIKKVLIDEQNLLCLTNNSIVKYGLDTKSIDSYDLPDSETKDIILTESGKYLLIKNESLTITNDYKISGTKFFTTTAKINVVSYDPQTGSLFVALSSGKILYWKNFNSETEMPEELANMTDANWGALGFNPQKNLLAAGTGTNDGVIYLWDISSGQLKNTLRGHNGWIKGISFSNDGHLMASASNDGSVNLWHVEDLNTLPIPFDDHEAWVTSVIFSSDDSYAISGDFNGNVKVLPTEITTIMNDYCDYLTRDLTEAEWTNYVGADIEYEPTKCKKP